METPRVPSADGVSGEHEPKELNSLSAPKKMGLSSLSLVLCDLRDTRTHTLQEGSPPGSLRHTPLLSLAA